MPGLACYTLLPCLPKFTEMKLLKLLLLLLLLFAWSVRCQMQLSASGRLLCTAGHVTAGR